MGCTYSDLHSDVERFSPLSTVVNSEKTDKDATISVKLESFPNLESIEQQLSKPVQPIVLSSVGKPRERALSDNDKFQRRTPPVRALSSTSVSTMPRSTLASVSLFEDSPPTSPKRAVSKFNLHSPEFQTEVRPMTFEYSGDTCSTLVSIKNLQSIVVTPNSIFRFLKTSNTTGRSQNGSKVTSPVLTGRSDQ